MKLIKILHDHKGQPVYMYRKSFILNASPIPSIESTVYLKEKLASKELIAEKGAS